MTTHIVIPPMKSPERALEIIWRLRYFELREELVKANKGLRRLRAKLDRVPRWFRITKDSLPEPGEIVWLWDGQRAWIGGRSQDGGGWEWGDTNGNIWFNGERFDGDIEHTNPCKPTHWMALAPHPRIPRQNT